MRVCRPASHQERKMRKDVTLVRCLRRGGDVLFSVKLCLSCHGSARKEQFSLNEVKWSAWRIMSFSVFAAKTKQRIQEVKRL